MKRPRDSNNNKRMLKKALKRLKRGDVTSKDVEALREASRNDDAIARRLREEGRIELQIKKGGEGISSKQFRSFVRSMVSDTSSCPNWITLKNATLIRSVVIVCVDTPLRDKKIMTDEFAKGRRVLHVDMRVNKENQSVRNLAEGLIMFPVEAKIPTPTPPVQEEEEKKKKKKDDDEITEEELTRNEDHETLLRWSHPIDILQENEYPIPGSSLPDGFVRTCPRRSKDKQDKTQPIVAIDCEMCKTKNGLELTRVTVLDYAGKTLLDELVMPDSPILDYVTKYSGITEEMMKGVTTTLSQVRERIMQFVKADYTVMIGHSLECDLNALRMSHLKIVDSAIMYPHRQGRPYKNKLRYLTSTYLNREIQSSDTRVGHDSGEDARAALDLVRLKLSKGASFGIPAGAKALKSMFSTLDTTSQVKCFCVNNSTEERIGKHIVPEEFVTSQPCTNDLAVLQYTLKLMNEVERRKKRTLVFSSLRSVPNDDLSDMMTRLGHAIPLNSVLVVVNRKVDPGPVRQEAQNRWKGRRDKSWTSEQEKEYRKMIRKTQDADMFVTFNNRGKKKKEEGDDNMHNNGDA